MRDGDDVGGTQLGLAQPRAEVAGNARVGHLALVTADGIEGQRRCIGSLRTDFAVGNQPEFHQSLEAVADAQHKSVALVEKFHNGIGNLRVAEDTGNEFGAAFRLVAGTKATRNHNNLTALDGIDVGIHALTNLLAVLVAEDDNLALGTGAVEGASAVVFAVGSREGRDEDVGLDRMR